MMTPHEGRLQRVYAHNDAVRGRFDEIGELVRLQGVSNEHTATLDGGGALRLVQGNIVNIPADAIVNTTNPSLRNGGAGVDAAIHAAAGPELQRQLDGFSARYRGSAPVGTVVVTDPGRLPARKIFHVVSPLYGRTYSDPSPLLLCYRNIFATAEAQQITRIAVPAISTGNNGYPVQVAAPIAIEAALEHLRRNGTLREIIFVLFSPADFSTHAQEVRRRFPSSR
jgi:serine/threonine-protein kinase